MYFNGALVGGAGINRLRAKEDDSKVATQIVFQCEDVPGTTDVTCKKKIFISSLPKKEEEIKEFIKPNDRIPIEQWFDNLNQFKSQGDRFFEHDLKTYSDECKNLGCKMITVLSMQEVSFIYYFNPKCKQLLYRLVLTFCYFLFSTF